MIIFLTLTPITLGKNNLNNASVGSIFVILGKDGAKPQSPPPAHWHGAQSSLDSLLLRPVASQQISGLSVTTGGQ